MSQVEEEKYLTNRAKVERIKAKVKIRFKPIGGEHRKGTGSSQQAALKILARCLLVIVLLVLRFAASSSRGVPTRVERRHSRASAPDDLRPTGSSELSFEYLGLKTIPSDQLCVLMNDEPDGPAKTRNQLNLVSFANNRINYINSSAFICIGIRLKILSLRNNQIELISPDAFNGLNHLQVLLLDGNRLREIPIVALNQLTSSLRHLNMAENLIESMEKRAPTSDTLNLANLISLSLRANPLRRINRGAFRRLDKLKTLTLSQVGLNETGGHLGRFEGLAELRYLHLDRLANLSSLETNYCESSRKLSSLNLKSNELKQVPQLTNCQALLSIDLSHNKISGALNGNFSSMTNLIDLYLGSNRIESLNEDAFKGLARLQVLELNSNSLKHIHANAFAPLRATLYELNLAHNLELAHLTHLKDLDQLVSFKSYGNRQLARLPHFPRAKLLAFTYAYHCCDYEAGGKRPSHWPIGAAPRGNDSSNRSASEVDSLEDEPNEGDSLLGQLFQSIFLKLARFLSARNQLAEDTSSWRHEADLDASGSPGEESGGLKLENQPGPASALASSDVNEANSQQRNISEIVLWPNEALDLSSASHRTDSNQAQASASLRAPVGAPEARAERARRWTSQMGLPTSREARRWPKGRDEEATLTMDFSRNGRRALIDELIWQVKQIRFSHSVGGGGGGSGEKWPLLSEQTGPDAYAAADVDLDDYALATDANGHDRGPELEQEGQLFLSSRLGHFELLDEVAEQLARQLGTSLTTGAIRNKRATRRQAAPMDQQQWDSAIAAAGRPRAGPLQCLPKPHAFQPCRDLFDSAWLRASIWLVFLLALVGNILVIVVLGSVRPSSSASALTSIMWFNAAHSKRHIDVPRFLVINLAVADLLMALYLGLLVFVDLSTLGEFRAYAIKWQHSAGCQLAGFLAVLSSELSVFILAIITLERNYAITNAVHLNRRLSLQKAMVAMLFGYLYALTMAVLPLNGINDYRQFGVCLPLEFHSDRPLWGSPANLYLVTLVAINSLSFILLVSCYLRMYCAIRGSQAWNTNDLKIAKRMSILVLTDFMCWIPIIFFGSLALLGRHLIGPDGLKVLVIFILPLNSVANPFLYAITTKKFKRDLKILKKRLKLDQMAELLRLLVGLVTTCKLHRRRAPKYEPSVTVAIRRNRYRCVPDETRKAAQKELANKNRQLAVMVDQGGRTRGAHPRATSMDACAHRAIKATAQQQLGQTNKRTIKLLLEREMRQQEPQEARRGSRLLAKTMRLVRGAPDREPADEPLDESRFLNAANNSCNQVTMNKTTCFSCQQRLVAANNSLGSKSSLSKAQQEQHSHLPIRPRIVLDSIELRSDDVLRDTLTPPETPREFLAQQQLHLAAVQAPQQLSGRTSCQSDLNTNQLGGLPVSATSSAAFVGHNLRASSADEPAADRDNQSTLAAHLSCHTILINERESRTRIRADDEPNLEPPDRSASACTFNYPRRVARMQDRPQPTFINPTQVCSCSCDAIGAQARTSSCNAKVKHGLIAAYPGKQSRSINKLVFEPLAKAWSTLQVSLQTQWTVTPTTSKQEQQQQQQQQQHELQHHKQQQDQQPLPQECVRLASESKRDLSSDERESSYSTDSANGAELMDQTTIIDDILQMSSPAKKRLLNERRMSRSCDLIINHAASQEANSSSGATNEPSSSLYDQHDDQRILLATINQLTTRRKKRRAHGKAQQLEGTRRGRAACTRCRSWSPALLEKLEDCMHQIKSRLPKLGSKEQTLRDDADRNYQAMAEPSTLPSSTTNTDVSVRFTSELEQKSMSAMRFAGAEVEYSSDEAELNGLEVDDDFNETGLAEWRKNMQKKAPASCYNNKPNRRRLHQQLSGNSDTLSSRTFGTTFTNLSFDSNSSIPAVVAGSEPPPPGPLATGHFHNEEGPQ